MNKLERYKICVDLNFYDFQNRYIKWYAILVRVVRENRSAVVSTRCVLLEAAVNAFPRSSFASVARANERRGVLDAGRFDPVAGKCYKASA